MTHGHCGDGHRDKSSSAVCGRLGGSWIGKVLYMVAWMRLCLLPVMISNTTVIPPSTRNSSLTVRPCSMSGVRCAALSLS